MFEVVVRVEELCSPAYMHRAMRRCGATRDEALEVLYRRRHSVLYARLFWIDLEGVTDRVHTHLVRSRVGVDWWVETQRPDRGGVPGLRNMSAVINASALITLAQKRLCARDAWGDTRLTVLALREAVRQVDPALAQAMQPLCVWERGCVVGGCGWYERQILDDRDWPVEVADAL